MNNSNGMTQTLVFNKLFESFNMEEMNLFNKSFKYYLSRFKTCVHEISAGIESFITNLDDSWESFVREASENSAREN